MTTIEKIKAEIDRLIELHCKQEKNLRRYECYDSAKKAEQVIDSLQQEQPIKVNTLTWKDINNLERIINNVHYEFRNGISAKGFGEEVLERFMEERDEQEQPEVDLEKEIDRMWNPRFNLGWDDNSLLSINHKSFEAIARHFYEFGKNAK